jgi:serine/threonine protein kinase
MNLIAFQVAIKILEKEKIKDHADLERINREITILKKVRHPNVVQLYDVSYLRDVLNSALSPFRAIFADD